MTEIRHVPFHLASCPCVAEHRPEPPWSHEHHIWPLSWGGPDDPSNIVAICPATHDRVHQILRVFEREGGIVPRRVGWPRYAHQLACEGWRRSGRPR